MFAVNRTAKAIGRIIFLVISIITINGIRTFGVPEGTRCLSVVLVNLIQKNTIIDIQIGSASDREKDKWAEQQNEYGKFLVILLVKIKKKRAIGTSVVPFIIMVFVNRDENSLFNIIVIFFIKILIRDCVFQYISGKRMDGKIIDLQFIGINFTLVGSNIENNLVIIWYL